MHRSGFRFGSGLLRRGRHDRRRSRLSTRNAGGARWRLAGEALEPRALLAVTAVNASGVLQITLGAADDAATLSNDGTNYVVQGTGLPGSFLSANTSVSSVSVVGSAGTNQSFAVAAGAGTVLTDPLTVDASVEKTAILGAVNVGGFLQARVSVGSAAITLAADVSTNASQSYGGAVTVVGQRTLFASSIGGITFNGTVDSSPTVVSSLATRTGLGTTFKNSVGGQTALASLVTSPITGSAGTTAFGSPSVANVWVRTNGAAGQAFNCPVVLAGNTDFRAGVGPITFAGTVDGTYDLKAYSQATTTFGGAVGGKTALASLMTNPNGTTVVGSPTAADVMITTYTAAGQVFNDAVVLAGNTTFRADVGSITFAGTVDGTYGLTAYSLATTTFGGAVGGTTALASLATNPGGTTVVGSPTVAGVWVRTNGAAGQAFNSPVVLAGNTDFRAGIGPITFASTVDGACRLQAYSQAATTFGGVVGGTKALASLMTNPNGTTLINGGAITTTTAAGQAFNDPVTLGTSTTLAAGAGPITFAGTVDGAFLRAPDPAWAVSGLGTDRGVNLAWASPALNYGAQLTTRTSGTTTFSGAVGGTTPLIAVVTSPLGTRAGTGTITTAPITDYVVQRSVDNGLNWTTFAHGVSAATSAAVSGLTNGTSYVFRVAAVNRVGTGPFSAKSAAIVAADRFRPVFSGQTAVVAMDLVGSSVNTGEVGISGPVFSPDGSKVAFTSDASNLVAGDTNNQWDVFVKDLGTGAIVRVSTDAAGNQGDSLSYYSAFSPDGTKVAFVSWATNLVPGDTNKFLDVFVKDLGPGGAIVRVSTDAAGNQAAGNSFIPIFSPDGTKVMFESYASNLVAGDTNGKPDVFVKDLGPGGAIVRVSTDPAGNQLNGGSSYPVFSPDGRKVAFASAASNLVPGDTNNVDDMFVKDLMTGTITRVSTSAAGSQANDNSYTYCAFSPDGTKVAFESNASNLVPGDTNRMHDVFVKDLVTEAIGRVSTDAAGNQGDEDSYSPVFGPDGTKVTFASYASNLVAGDTNGTLDVFVKDLVTGAISRVSTTAAGTEANSDSYSPVFGPDGTKVAFMSYASNLVPGDTNGYSDVFVATLGFVRSQSENTTVVGTFAATDRDPGTTLTYGLAGPDAARFTINAATGAVSFVAPPDFENPADFNHDNTYEIDVTASDGTFLTKVRVKIRITDVIGA